MKNNKLLASILLASLLVTGCSNGKKKSDSSTSFSSESTSSEQTTSIDSSSSSEGKSDEFIVANAPYYRPAYSSGDYTPAKVTDFTYGYFSDNPYFIYMPLVVPLNFFFYGEYVEGISEHFYSYMLNECDLSITVDAEENEMTFHNYDEVNLFSKAHDSPLGVIDEEHTKEYVDVSGCSYQGGHDVIFRLGEYSLDIIEKDNTVYIPFSILNNIFFTNAYYSPVGFNGTAFYLLDMVGDVASLSYRDNSFMKQYYNGACRGKTRNEKFINDNFNALMFQFDHFYGFLDERFVPFEQYLKHEYPEIITALYSSSHSEYTKAVNRILDEVIGDGHTNSGNASTVFGTGTVNSPSYHSEREIELSNIAYDCYYRRANALGYSFDPVRFKNNTAIVSFDGFYHRAVSFTKTNITAYKNDDGFALFYYVFEQIKKKGNIENIIFDVSVNGGGDTNALIPMLGFLTNNVELTMYNPLSTLQGDLLYKVDTNLDGIYDENDSYEGQYNFFVLTSGYSFSCANLFTSVCKNSGLATIIGQQSGGGACVVSYTSTPDGKPFRISGLARDGFIDKPAEHYDYGVPVDAEIAYENFYNDTYLDEFVSNYHK